MFVGERARVKERESETNGKNGKYRGLMFIHLINTYLYNCTYTTFWVQFVVFMNANLVSNFVYYVRWHVLLVCNVYAFEFAFV